MKKRLIALLLIAAMSSGVLAGCGQQSAEGEQSSESSKKEESKQSTESQEEVEEISNFNEEGFPIVNEEITLKILYSVADQDFNNFAKPEDIPVIQEMEKLTNIKTEWQAVLKSNWETETNLMWASGEYPDVIIGDIDVENYGVTQQALIPLDDLIEKYAFNITDRIAMEDSDPTMAMVASDGQIYATGYMVSQNMEISSNHFINKKWLETLGLEKPTTIEGLTDVLRKFKTEDPNGNGKADEIPAVLTIDKNNTGDYSIYRMLPLFGISSHNTYIDNDGKVQFGAVQEEFRNMLEWLNMLYVEGLMDPDAFSQDSASAGVKVTDRTAGFFGGWRLTAMGLGDEDIKDFYELFYTNDACYSRNLETSGNRVFITVTNEHPEATMRWINTLYDTENMFSLYYGPKMEPEENDGTKYGWYYDTNGKITTVNAPKDAQNRLVLSTNGPFFAPGNYSNEVYNMAPYRVEKAEYSDLLDEAGLLEKYSNWYFKLCKFTTEETERIATLKTDLNTAIYENVAALVEDGVTDKSWNDFVKLLEEIGYQEYVNAYQEKIDELGIVK